MNALLFHLILSDFYFWLCIAHCGKHLILIYSPNKDAFNAQNVILCKF